MQCATYYSGSAHDVPRVQERLLSFGFVPPYSHVYTDPTPSAMVNSIVHYLLKYASAVADDMESEKKTTQGSAQQQQMRRRHEIGGSSSSNEQPRVAICGMGADERVARCLLFSSESVVAQLFRLLLEGGPSPNTAVGVRMHRIHPGTSTLAGGGDSVPLTSASAFTKSEETAESAALAAIGMQKESAFTTFSSVAQYVTRVSVEESENEAEVDSVLLEIIAPVSLVRHANARVGRQRNETQSHDVSSVMARGGADAEVSTSCTFSVNTPDSIRFVLFALADKDHLSEFVGPFMSLVADEFAATVIMAETDFDVVFYGNYAAQIMSKSGFAAREGRKALRKDPILFTEAAGTGGKAGESGGGRGPSAAGRLRIGSGLPRSAKPQSLAQALKGAHPYDLPSAALTRGMRRFSSTPDRLNTQTTRSVSETTVADSVMSSITSHTPRIEYSVGDTAEEGEEGNRPPTPPPLPAPLADGESSANRSDGFRSLPHLYELSSTQIHLKSDPVSPRPHCIDPGNADSKSFPVPTLARCASKADITPTSTACTSENEYISLFERLNNELKTAQECVSALRQESSRRAAAERDQAAQLEAALRLKTNAAAVEAQRARDIVTTLESRRTALEQKREALQARLRAAKNRKAEQLNAASRAKAAERERALSMECEKMADEKSFLAKECEKWRALLAAEEKKRAASLIAGYARGPARNIHASPGAREEDVATWRHKAVMEFVRCESARRATIMCNEMAAWENLCLAFQTTSHERRRIVAMIESRNNGNRDSEKKPFPPSAQKAMPHVVAQPQARANPTAPANQRVTRADRNQERTAPHHPSHSTSLVQNAATTSHPDETIPRRFVSTPHITASPSHRPLAMYSVSKPNGSRALATTGTQEIMAMDVAQVESVVEEAALQYELQEAMQLYEETNAEQQALIEMLESTEHNAAYLHDVEERNALVALLDEQSAVNARIKQLRQADRKANGDDDDDDDAGSSDGSEPRGIHHRFEEQPYEPDVLNTALCARAAREAANAVKLERQRRRELKKQLKSTEAELEHAMRSYRDEVARLDDQRSIQRTLVQKIKLYES